MSDHSFIRALDGPPPEGRTCLVCGGQWLGAQQIGDDVVIPRRFVELRIALGGADPVVNPNVLISEHDEPARTVRMHRDPASGAAVATMTVEHEIICSDCISAAARALGYVVDADALRIACDEQRARAEQAERQLADLQKEHDETVAGFRVARTLHRLLAAEVADELVAMPEPESDSAPRRTRRKEAA